MANALKTGDIPGHATKKVKAKDSAKRKSQVGAMADLTSTKFADLTDQEKDDLLKCLFLAHELIAPD